MVSDTRSPESRTSGSVSVIIPTCDDAAELARCLRQLRPAEDEVIVVDASSDDATKAVAESAGCQVIRSRHRHRARQMNLGASVATGAIFLFLHADTNLPLGAIEKIRAVMKDPDVVGGAFARKYKSRSLFLAITCWLAKWRGRFFGWYLGDQAIFVRREGFDALHGYSDFSLFEDLDFSRRMRGLGKTVSLLPTVVSSARRFERRGPFATTLDDVNLTRRYLAGADPNLLASQRVDLRGERGGLFLRKHPR